MRWALLLMLHVLQVLLWVLLLVLQPSRLLLWRITLRAHTNSRASPKWRRSCIETPSTECSAKGRLVLLMLTSEPASAARHNADRCAAGAAILAVRSGVWRSDGLIAEVLATRLAPFWRTCRLVEPSPVCGLSRSVAEGANTAATTATTTALCTDTRRVPRSSACFEAPKLRRIEDAIDSRRIHRRLVIHQS
jgi:hypothetical protein